MSDGLAVTWRPPGRTVLGQKNLENLIGLGVDHIDYTISPATERVFTRKSLERFVSIYGAEAGNLALKVMATGGVYVAGGISPKILPVLRDGRFTEAFNAKGAFADLMRSMPVRVVLNPETALLGAARVASEL